MSSATARKADWYDEPAAYDIVFDADTRAEARFLLSMLERHGPRSRSARKRILEPACGSGRLVAELARRGHAVTGFDLNPAMLAYARARLARRGLRARLSRADMASFDVPGRFELAHCLVSTFKYLLDEESARAHLAGVARALVPGGLYVLGFHLTDYARERTSRERWVAERGRTRVTCVTSLAPANARSRVENVTTRLTVERGSRRDRTVTHWQFRTYDARQFTRLLDSVGTFELVALHDFHYEPEYERSTTADGIADCVFVLRKREEGGIRLGRRPTHPGRPGRRR